MTLEEAGLDIKNINSQISGVCEFHFFEVQLENYYTDGSTANVRIEIRHYIETPASQRPFRAHVIDDKQHVDANPWTLSGDGETLGGAISNIVMKFRKNLKATRDPIIRNT
jgi:hypothetical protein